MCIKEHTHKPNHTIKVHKYGRLYARSEFFMDKLFDLSGKVAVVTGGSRGLGYSMSEAFLLAGAAKVYVSSRSESACDEAAQALNDLANQHKLNGRAFSAAADCSSDEGVNKLFELVSAKESKVDILASNAGAHWGAEFGNHPGEAFDMVLGLNVKGVFLTIQAFAPLLVKAGSVGSPSRVIVTGSVLGLSNTFSGGGYGYLSSKAAVHHLVKSLSVELGPENITVNAVAPGVFPTKMTDGVIDSFGDTLIESNPLRRLGKPEDIMGAVVYLCSGAGSYVNGAILPLDGGFHLSGFS